MKDTKENILDVAERLFAANGYAGTSIRAIVEEAEVNIAAINYHFNSKEGLFMAVIKRRFSEIEKERFGKLDLHLEKNNGQPTLEGVVRSFLEPLKTAFETENQVPKMLVRIFCESEELREMLNPIFDKTKKRFSTALGKVFKNLPVAEVKWRFQYMVSAMVGLIIFSEEVQNTMQEFQTDENIIEKLITQVLEGIK